VAARLLAETSPSPDSSPTAELKAPQHQVLRAFAVKALPLRPAAPIGAPSQFRDKPPTPEYVAHRRSPLRA